MASDPQNNTIATDAYVSFDASSMKQMMVRNLTDAGILTDQRYEGSNVSSVINIMAVAYQSLLFYLNKTASESSFSTAELYENMNRMVRLIGYNPIGYQTSTLSFGANLQPSGSTSLGDGIYTIPRFAYFRLNNINYAFAEDAVFSVTGADNTIDEMAEQTILYQGKYVEYPAFTAAGTLNESFVITLPATTMVDHFTVHVYVKDAVTGKWDRWEKTESLFLEDDNAKKYNLRLNENKLYEVRMGDGVFGKALGAGDTVQIYYLQSDGSDGEVGIGNLDGKPLVLFSTPNYDEIIVDTSPSVGYRYIEDADVPFLNFVNANPSSPVKEWETVDEIRNNAPGVFRSQNRLVTASDFENLLKSKAANFIGDVVAVNNKEYVNTVIRYYHTLGLTFPHTESRILFNHINFADACDFNNVYAFCLPRSSGSLVPYNNFLSVAQKQFIIDSVEDLKMASAEIVPSDPVYIEASIEATSPGVLESTDLGFSFIEITRDTTQRIPDSTLKEIVASILIDEFDKTSKELGSSIDIAGINNKINSTKGIRGVATVRIVNGSVVTRSTGITIMLLNPVYPLADQTVISSNVTLDFFKAVYLKHTKEDILNKIILK